jgi:uncharacterized protein (TIGR03382 family)
MRRVLSVAVVAAIASLVVVPVAAGWSWPADGPVLRPFTLGSDEYAAGQHRGIDIGAAVGDPVRAPVAGTASFVGSVPGGGHALTIQTADGYAVTMLQLGSVAVTRGTSVGEGAVVGQVGESEDAGLSVPHLHLGIRVASEPNGYVDPLGLLPSAAAPETAPAPEPDPAPAPTPEPAAPAEPAPAVVPEARPSIVGGSLPEVTTARTPTQPVSRRAHASSSPQAATAGQARPRPVVQSAFAGRPAPGPVRLTASREARHAESASGFARARRSPLSRPRAEKIVRPAAAAGAQQLARAPRARPAATVVRPSFDRVAGVGAGQVVERSDRGGSGHGTTAVPAIAVALLLLGAWLSRRRRGVPLRRVTRAFV